MHVQQLSAAAAAALLSLSAMAEAATAGQQVLDFENLANGTVLSTQYEALGVRLRANAFTGAGNSSSGQPWATNTDLTVLDIALQNEESALSAGPFATGKVLRAYEAWLDEDGDPSFELLFASPVTAVQASFVAVDIAGGKAVDTRLFAYNGQTLLGVVRGDAGASDTAFNLAFSAPAITRAVIAPGTWDDWVAVDNITITSAVPEPNTLLLLAAGIVAIAAKTRRGRLAFTSDS